MNKDVKLYLGGEAVDWPKVPDILLTYQRTDYLNPTIVKNMFSKTVTIEGTPNNNRIFSHIWNLDSVMDMNETLFNPNQRVQFELFNNAELVEKGYAKLDSFTKEGYKIAYNITLYGGLGSFFYSLAYNINTDKERTLADLNYLGTSNPDDEFNFTISKEAVNEAWTSIGSTGNTGKWGCINFIPCYNGVPEDFDADRFLLNTHYLDATSVRWTDGNNLVNTTFPFQVTNDGNAYWSKNGYLTGTMMRECNEWEMRDLRSYLQRPCLSVKGLFNAICDPQNNGGYDVQLDSDFFSSGNPYYYDAWITLPMLAPETEGTDEMEDWEWYIDDKHYYGDYSVQKNVKWKLASVSPILGSPDMFQMDVEIHAIITGATANTLYTSTLDNNSHDPDYDPDPDFPEPPNPPQFTYLGCTTVQMYGMDSNLGVWYNKQAKCGSNIIILTSKLNGNYISTQDISRWYNIPYNESDFQYNFGYWKRVSGDDFIWHNETDNTDLVHIQMDTNFMSEIPNIGIGFGNVMLVNGMLQGNRCGYCYDSQYYDALSSNGMFKYWDTMDFNCLEGKIVYKVNGKMRSFQPVTKKDLLGGLDGTPCDWLLSYCKLFGLFIEKDKFNDTIYIKLRNNWYVNDVVDLDSLVDRGKEINVTPLTFESKWYSFNYLEAEGKLLDRYKKEYSQDFGKQLVDTKYNFDSTEIELLEDTKFRNGLMALEKSNYFNTKRDTKDQKIPQCFFNWCTMTYYDGLDTYEVNMCLPSGCTTEELNANTPNEFYDAMPKLQMRDESKSPTDGDGVLVFFNGIRNTGNADYWISDDVDEMFIDSDKPCWLQTVHEFNEKWTQKIAIMVNSLPEFNRYVLHNKIITATWDFGYTKELYVPYYRYDVNRTPTMYENFWKSYIQDLYSVNTRKVECYVALDSNNVYDFMKRFYWWDNSLWVCTKVSDFDIALDRSTLCSFTKVNDIASYLEPPTFDDYFFNFYRTNGTYNIPAMGTDEERSVYFNLDSSANWVVIDAGVGYVSFSPQYPTSGSFVIGQTIKSTFMPNYNPLPRWCTYVAANYDGHQISVSVMQEGYVKPTFLTLEPNSVSLPRIVETPEQVNVNSSSNWHCTQNSWVTISPSSGTSGNTMVSVSATTNEGLTSRSAQIPFNNSDGLQAYLMVTQKANYQVSLEQNEITPVYSVAWTGGNVFYKIISEIDTEVRPSGNTGNFAVASGLVEYNTTIPSTTGTSFWIHFSPNNSTVTRNAMFYDYYEDGGNPYYVYPTVVQLPLVQLASGNTIVELTDKGQGVTTLLGGSGMTWTATTNDSWITILTPSGTSSDISVEYTVENNYGGYRIGYIYITYTDEMGLYCQEIIEVHQEGIEPSMNVSPTEINATYRGGDYFVNVTANTSYTVSVQEGWASYEILGNDTFSLHVDENDGYDRTQYITVVCGNESRTVTLNQESSMPSGYTLDYEPSDIIFDSTGGTIDVTVRSDSNWTIVDGTHIG